MQHYQLLKTAESTVLRSNKARQLFPKKDSKMTHLQPQSLKYYPYMLMGGKGMGRRKLPKQGEALNPEMQKIPLQRSSGQSAE